MKYRADGISRKKKGRANVNPSAFITCQNVVGNRKDLVGRSDRSRINETTDETDPERRSKVWAYEVCGTTDGMSSI